ncbi:MAG: CHRD domain-containing protein [Candidatus Korobacteraceae bacterium]
MKRYRLSVTEKCITLKHHFKLAMGALAFACLVLLPTGNVLQAQEATSAPYLRATLSSFNQVPSVLAPSNGRFEAEITPDATISFSLTYDNMSSPVQQAHIHFGASRTNGGVVVFLCGGPKPACPASGTITGVLTAADVSVLPANNPDSVIPQGIQPGDLAGLLQAIRSGNTYVNVHTANFPSGELRGQVELGGQGRIQ